MLFSKYHRHHASNFQDIGNNGTRLICAQDDKQKRGDLQISKQEEVDQKNSISASREALLQSPAIQAALQGSSLDQQQVFEIRNNRKAIDRVLDSGKRDQIKAALSRYEKEQEQRQVLEILENDEAEKNTSALLNIPIDRVWSHIQIGAKFKNAAYGRNLQRRYLAFLESGLKQSGEIRSKTEKLLRLENIPADFWHQIRTTAKLKQDKAIVGQLETLMADARGQRYTEIDRGIGDANIKVLQAITAENPLESSSVSPEKMKAYLSKLQVLGPEVVAKAESLLAVEKDHDLTSRRETMRQLADIISQQWSERMGEATREGSKEMLSLLQEATEFFLGNEDFSEPGLVDMMGLSTEEVVQYKTNKRNFFAETKQIIELAANASNPESLKTQALTIIAEKADSLGISEVILKRWQAAFIRACEQSAQKREQAQKIYGSLPEFRSDLQAIARQLWDEEWPQGITIAIPQELQKSEYQDVFSKIKSFFEAYEISEANQDAIWNYLRKQRNGQPTFPYEALGSVQFWAQEWNLENDRDAAEMIISPGRQGQLPMEMIASIFEDRKFPHEVGSISSKTEALFKGMVHNLACATFGEPSPQAAFLEMAQAGIEAETGKILGDMTDFAPEEKLEQLGLDLRRTLKEKNEALQELRTALQNRLTSLETVSSFLPSGQSDVEAQLNALRLSLQELRPENYDEALSTIRAALQDSTTSHAALATNIKMTLERMRQQAEQMQQSSVALVAETTVLREAITEGQESGSLSAATVLRIHQQVTRPVDASISQRAHKKEAEHELFEATTMQCQRIPELYQSLRQALYDFQQNPAVSQELNWRNWCQELLSMQFEGIPLIQVQDDWDARLSDTGFAFDTINGNRPRILVNRPTYETLRSGHITPETIRGLLHEMGHMLAPFKMGGFISTLRKKGIWNDFITQGRQVYRDKKLLRRGILRGKTTTELTDSDIAEEFLVSYLTGSQYADLSGFDALRTLVENTLSREELSQLSSFLAPEISKKLAGAMLTNNPFAALWKKRLQGETAMQIEQITGSISNSDEANHKVEILKDFEAEKDQITPKINFLAKSSIPEARQNASIAQISLNNMTDVLTASVPGEIDDNFDRIVTEIKQLEKDLDAIMTRISETEKVELSYPVMLWKNTEFLSCIDIFEMGKRFVTTFGERRQRNEGRRQGKAGNAMFSRMYPNAAVEYRQLEQQKEREQVQKYQDNIANMDVYQIYDIIKVTRNVDEFKAAMRVLAQKGRINWNDRDIWRALKRLGSSEDFQETAFYNTATIASKMQRAFSSLYDTDEYRQLERDNLSNYTSGKSQFEREADQLQGVLEAQIREMIKNYRKDKASIDPQRYEIFVETLIKNGKGDPSSPMYYTILGVYEGILTPERAAYFDRQYLNNYPITQFIDSHKADYSDFKKWVERNNFADKNGHMAIDMPAKFREWLHFKGLTNKAVVERTYKATGQAVWDHDYTQLNGAIGNAGQAKEFIEKRDGDRQHLPTAYQNALSGILEHSVFLARNRGRLSHKDIIETFARQAGYFSMGDGILNGRVLYGTKYYHFTRSEKNSPPRDKGSFEKVNSTQQFMELNRQVFEQTAPEFFAALYTKMAKEGPRAEEEKSLQMGEILKQYHSDFLREKLGGVPPSNLEGVYDAVEDLVRYQLNKHPERFQQMLDKAVSIGMTYTG